LWIAATCFAVPYPLCCACPAALRLAGRGGARAVQRAGGAGAHCREVVLGPSCVVLAHDAVARHLGEDRRGRDVGAL
jgi:hypothetical protein